MEVKIVYKKHECIGTLSFIASEKTKFSYCNLSDGRIDPSYRVAGATEKGSKNVGTLCKLNFGNHSKCKITGHSFCSVFTRYSEKKSKFYQYNLHLLVRAKLSATSGPFWVLLLGMLMLIPSYFFKVGSTPSR